eukprot:CAMPEP_0114501554 /NCGR_PEP_ID=MMETSP0109-20121206/8557_1 /TAXON_ID=29199 /ORGANISM="Chlorarachnion reptans, Strain CCCM449" /LENGTH=415 /DNA_ID=CAMNT_0001679285 /DNA_START=35 /DNA_END=1279 /DNA_ORIENTATION=+
MYFSVNNLATKGQSKILYSPTPSIVWVKRVLLAPSRSSIHPRQTRCSIRRHSSRTRTATVLTDVHMGIFKVISDTSRCLLLYRQHLHVRTWLELADPRRIINLPRERERHVEQQVHLVDGLHYLLPSGVIAEPPGALADVIPQVEDGSPDMVIDRVDAPDAVGDEFEAVELGDPYGAVFRLEEDDPEILRRVDPIPHPQRLPLRLGPLGLDGELEPVRLLLGLNNVLALCLGPNPAWSSLNSLGTDAFIHVFGSASQTDVRETGEEGREGHVQRGVELADVLVPQVERDELRHAAHGEPLARLRLEDLLDFAEYRLHLLVAEIDADAAQEPSVRLAPALGPRAGGRALSLRVAASVAVSVAASAGLSLSLGLPLTPPLARTAVLLRFRRLPEPFDHLPRARRAGDASASVSVSVS